MQIRTGFVSNSSSSSFLIVGVKVDEYKDEYDEMDLYYYHAKDQGFDSDVVGIEVDYTYNHSWKEITIKNIEKNIEKFKEYYPEMGEPLIFFGGGSQ